MQALYMKARERLMQQGVSLERASAIASKLVSVNALLFGPDGSLRVNVNDDSAWQTTLKLAPSLIDVDRLNGNDAIAKARRAQAREAQLRAELGDRIPHEDPNGYSGIPLHNPKPPPEAA